jgi:hypothetical protein
MAGAAGPTRPIPARPDTGPANPDRDYLFQVVPISAIRGQTRASMPLRLAKSRSFRDGPDGALPLSSRSHEATVGGFTFSRAANTAWLTLSFFRIRRTSFAFMTGTGGRHLASITAAATACVVKEPSARRIASMASRANSPCSNLETGAGPAFLSLLRAVPVGTAAAGSMMRTAWVSASTSASTARSFSYKRERRSSSSMCFTIRHPATRRAWWVHLNWPFALIQEAKLCMVVLAS